MVNPLPGGSAVSAVTSPGASGASITVQFDGQIVGSGNVSSFLHNWFQPTSAGVGASYWVRFTLDGGDAVTGGTTGAWLQLNTNRTISYTVPGPGLGQLFGAFRIQIATDAAGANIVADSGPSAYTMQAEVT